MVRVRWLGMDEIIGKWRKNMILSKNYRAKNSRDGMMSVDRKQAEMRLPV